MNCISDININNDDTLVWKWNRLSYNAYVASSVYNYLNSDSYSNDQWNGWHEIWRLPVIPRIKVHVQKLAHVKLPTYAHLYNLNIGPKNLCPFCGLENETVEHLFQTCSKILHCWHDLFAKLGLPSYLIDSLRTGTWLLDINDPWSKALIATITWFIQKQRCNRVFRNEPVNTCVILPRDWSLCYDRKRHSIRECALLRTKSNTIIIFLMPLGLQTLQLHVQVS